MNLTSPAVAYIILVIPILTAFLVTGQGVYKLIRRETGGNVVFGFGIMFFASIGAAYFLFIK